MDLPIRYLAPASLVAGAFVVAVAGGDDIFSSDLLQPARKARRGSRIRIFFICFILYLIAALIVAAVRRPSSALRRGSKGRGPGLGTGGRDLGRDAS